MRCHEMLQRKSPFNLRNRTSGYLFSNVSSVEGDDEYGKFVCLDRNTLQHAVTHCNTL